MSADTRLEELGITLPPPPQQLGVYKLLVQTGNLAYLSGHGPFLDDGSLMKGRLGDDVTLEEGQKVARQVGLNLLATLKNELGSLDRVSRLIKSLALVNCTDDFFDQPAVINGFSELFAEVFGEEAGIGARSAMGTNSLPGNIPVEIEIIVELKN
ncbi:MAG: RidA family protein [Verrucomicrobiales bacterium]|nr:RidA family protein [Verrucomicrobiales bacterium]